MSTLTDSLSTLPSIRQIHGKCQVSYIEHTPIEILFSISFHTFHSSLIIASWELPLPVYLLPASHARRVLIAFKV